MRTLLYIQKIRILRIWVLNPKSIILLSTIISSLLLWSTYEYVINQDFPLIIEGIIYVLLKVFYRITRQLTGKSYFQHPKSVPYFKKHKSFFKEIVGILLSCVVLLEIMLCSKLILHLQEISNIWWIVYLKTIIFLALNFAILYTTFIIILQFYSYPTMQKLPAVDSSDGSHDS
ncbi:MAG: hypothetical protein VXY77_03890 [Pseudomonadota bacterium]|nr:hypothetical protein [Pseudomonadota bacterium]